MASIELDHVVLRVADLERALGFYRDLLGLPEEGRARYEQGRVRFVSVRLGNALIDLLHDPEHPGPQPAETFVHLCLRVEGDLVALRDRLVSSGITLVGNPEPQSRLGFTGDGLSLYVRDPDGHEVELKQA